MKYFSRKNIALKHQQSHQILANKDITNYFLVDSYSDFLGVITQDPSPSYYEFISDTSPVKLFFDVEIYSHKQPDHFESHIECISHIRETVALHFSDYKSTFIILESHSQTKRSYHIIVTLQNATNEFAYFSSVHDVKKLVVSLFSEFIDLKIIDPSVYREGIFRTIFSSKSGEARPLVKSAISDDFNIIDSFVAFCPEPRVTIESSHAAETYELILPTQQDLTPDDKDIIRKFVRKTFKYKPRDIRDVILDKQLNCIVIALNDTFCHNIDNDHKSNHQYIVIDTYSAKQKCHDTDCKDYKYNETKVNLFPMELNEILLKCLKVNKHEHELIEKAIKECKDYITQNFDENIEDIEFDKQTMVFHGGASNNSVVHIKGKCAQCQIVHIISDNGYCLKCNVCQTVFPKNQLIPIDDRFKNLNSFWMNYNQLVNNGTVNIITNNYFGGEEEFSCDVQLDNCIFRNKELTNIYNHILDGHKVVKISELMSKLESDFRYTNGEWYFFDGTIWKMDKESLEFRKRIVKLSSNFSKILHHYEAKSAGDSSVVSVIKSTKSLINKLHKTGFEDEIIKGAKMYYNDEEFFSKLNSKKHLVAFSNGVYDLISGEFRKSKKEDYINLTVKYDYNQQCENQEVRDFIDKVLPNENVRDYVLKKMSECLNGDIPNTNFLMFIGDGANGKSQLLNLMKLAMGDLGEKVEVTLLTRKRNNANEANTEKVKLMNKRFAFLSEPEDGEKINIGLLKELTGSEEIVARGLYQESMSFVMEAKLFLACNELPEIKGEDTALWRRIRVIDFPSRFVDAPGNPGEFQIDRTLPSRMREDTTWRQTFMNILINYYYKEVLEPIEVKVKTNEYRQDNDAFYNWFDENIESSPGNHLRLKEICEKYSVGKQIGNKEKGKIKREFEKCIKKKFTDVNSHCLKTTINGFSFQGWVGIKIKDDDGFH